MSENVAIGGSRKNPAVDRANSPKVTTNEKAQVVVAEMKATVLDVTKVKTPDIPINFYGSVEKH